MQHTVMKHLAYLKLFVDRTVSMHVCCCVMEIAVLQRCFVFLCFHPQNIPILATVGYRISICPQPASSLESPSTVGILFHFHGILEKYNYQCINMPENARTYTHARK